jgi:hypothetical protein
MRRHACGHCARPNVIAATDDIALRKAAAVPLCVYAYSCIGIDSRTASRCLERRLTLLRARVLHMCLVSQSVMRHGSSDKERALRISTRRRTPKLSVAPCVCPHRTSVSPNVSPPLSPSLHDMVIANPPIPAHRSDRCRLTVSFRFHAAAAAALRSALFPVQHRIAAKLAHLLDLAPPAYRTSHFVWSVVDWHHWLQVLWNKSWALVSIVINLGCDRVPLTRMSGAREAGGVAA